MILKAYGISKRKHILVILAFWRITHSDSLPTCTLASKCITQRQFYNTYSTAKSAIVHSSIKLPLIRHWVKHFNCLKICSPIKAANSKKLPIHYSQSNSTATRVHCHHWRPLVYFGIIALGTAEFCCIISPSNLNKTEKKPCWFVKKTTNCNKLSTDVMILWMFEFEYTLNLLLELWLCNKQLHFISTGQFWIKIT